MSKLGKLTTDVTYGLLGIAMRPIYNQMLKERKAFDKQWNDSLKQAAQDAQAEARTFQVLQMQDPVVHIRGIW